MLTALACALALSQTEPAVSLNRSFAKGEKSRYEVKAHLVQETRVRGLRTFIPSDVDITYGFDTEVKEMKADGIALVHYKRPTVTVVDGETVDSPPKKTVEKVNMDALLTISPINEVMDVKDLSPQAQKKTILKRQLGGVFAQFVDGIGEMVLFVGSIDSGLDFAPKLPFEEVQPGATWKRTAGYSPQKLSGKDGKVANQRLDYTYTYQGVVESNGKKVHRVTAELTLDSNVADFVNQMVGSSASQTGVKEIDIKINSKIEFDLDLQTRKTLRALANSTGSAKFVTTTADDPAIEQKLKGRTLLRLIPAK